MKTDDAEHIAALVERLGRLLTSEAHADGLLPVQWEALRYLGKANRFSRTAAALVSYLGITKGTVSQTLKVLDGKGLVRKQVDAKDRRSNHLSLTATGRKLLRRDPLGSTVAAIHDLKPADRKALAGGLDSLLLHRLAAQERKPFGQCRDCRYFAVTHPDGGPHYCQLLQEKIAKTDAGMICFEQSPQTSAAF